METRTSGRNIAARFSVANRNASPSPTEDTLWTQDVNCRETEKTKRRRKSPSLRVRAETPLGISDEHGLTRRPIR
jgi:hypothetical protein